jgi:hypothetical protein
MNTLNILDAFSGTGNWVYPWKKTVSFNVNIDSVDILNLPHINHCMDIRKFELKKEYHIVYASFPCTHFSKMRNCYAKSTENEMKEAIELSDYAFWLASKATLAYIIENPYTGDAIRIYPNYRKCDYSEYGFPMRKRTAIWSNLPLRLKIQKEFTYNRLPLYSMTDLQKSAVPLPLAEYIKRIIIRTYNKELQKFKINELQV